MVNECFTCFLHPSSFKWSTFTSVRKCVVVEEFADLYVGVILNSVTWRTPWPDTNRTLILLFFKLTVLCGGFRSNLVRTLLKQCSIIFRREKLGNERIKLGVQNSPGWGNFERLLPGSLGTWKPLRKKRKKYGAIDLDQCAIPNRFVFSRTSSRSLRTCEKHEKSVQNSPVLR